MLLPLSEVVLGDLPRLEAAAFGLVVGLVFTELVAVVRRPVAGSTETVP